MTTRYGIIWPDGSYTGDVTDSQRLAAAYAKEHDGTVYEVGSDTDPERKEDLPHEKKEVI